MKREQSRRICTVCKSKRVMSRIYRVLLPFNAGYVWVCRECIHKNATATLTGNVSGYVRVIFKGRLPVAD